MLHAAASKQPDTVHYGYTAFTQMNSPLAFGELITFIAPNNVRTSLCTCTHHFYPLPLSSILVPSIRDIDGRDPPLPMSQMSSMIGIQFIPSTAQWIHGTDEGPVCRMLYVHTDDIQSIISGSSLKHIHYVFALQLHVSISA